MNPKLKTDPKSNRHQKIQDFLTFISLYRREAISSGDRIRRNSTREYPWVSLGSLLNKKINSNDKHSRVEILSSFDKPQNSDTVERQETSNDYDQIESNFPLSLLQYLKYLKNEDTSGDLYLDEGKQYGRIHQAAEKKDEEYQGNVPPYMS